MSNIDIFITLAPKLLHKSKVKFWGPTKASKAAVSVLVPALNLPFSVSSLMETVLFRTSHLDCR